ncbi:MAG: hypothetical protein A3F12_05565 [Gammaproteobacteria bacterium RIFCSPHIGHO2_12_FULL_38_14]|nr:MAG: hypothetical protein A3F12_05565 [Gammaproteobacteria bacterium RIFCSPHIGHO2_12_FULL_38_14]
MKILDFIEKLSSEIDEYRPYFPYCKSILVNLKIQDALDELLGLKNSKWDYKKEATAETLRPFVELLKKRYQGMEKRDDIYVHHPYVLGNYAYYILAKHLSPCCNNTHSYLLLMPSLNDLDLETQTAVCALPLHGFIFADNGTPINIGKCLDAAGDANTTTLYHTYGNGKGITPLNEAEKERVIHHSMLAFHYYNAIQFQITKNSTIPSNPQKYEFHHYLKGKFYQVSSSYGEMSHNRLKQDLFGETSKNPAKLINKMRKMERASWQMLLDELGIKYLKKVMLGQDSLMNCVQNNCYYQGNTNNKAVAFCFTEIYIDELSQGEKFKSKAAEITELIYAFGGTQFAYQIKSACGDELNIILKAVALWKAYLMTDEQLSWETLQKFLIDCDVNSEIKTVFSSAEGFSTIVRQATQTARDDCNILPRRGWFY